MKDAGNNLISISDLEVQYPSGGGLFGGAKTVKAVDGVSLDIQKGETVGLVGESGCGKSTLGKAILQLAKTSFGTVYYKDAELTGLSLSEIRRHRKRLQMIFQDPYASLDPRMTAGEIVAEPITAFGIAVRREAKIRAADLLETVGLGRRLVDRYPRELSGGQRQRIGIARALAVEPEFIVADEPISALDVSIQAQIMNLLQRLQDEHGLTYLFISHDLRAVRHLSDRIAVMYLGRVVELGPANDVYKDPLMPYTRGLIASVPVPDPQIERTRERIVLKGDVPSPIDPPSGCHFRTRCPYTIDECALTRPPLVEIKPRHFAACIRISVEHPDISENDDAGRRIA